MEVKFKKQNYEEAAFDNEATKFLPEKLIVTRSEKETALRNLEVSVYQPVGLKVVIIFSKGVDQLLSNLQNKT